MIKFCSLFSGSSGNCIFIGTDKAKILIDSGLSGSTVANALQEIGEDASKLNAIFVTHEHSDHVQSVGILSRRYDIPIYANSGTWCAMERRLGKIKEENKKILYKCDNQPCAEIGDILVQCYEIPHDAADPVAYTFNIGCRKISVATDIGHITDTIRNNIKGSDLMLVESNHDISMLETGRYPWDLKQRILGDNGHLSNEMAASLVTEMALNGTSRIFLGHLSGENNFPELAYETSRSMLTENDISVVNDVMLTVAQRERHSEIVML